MHSNYTRYGLLACFLPFFLSSCSAFTCQPCDERSEQVFNLLAQGNTRQAFTQLFKGATIANDQVRVNQLQSQTNSLLRSNKGVIGHEKIDQRVDGRLYTSVYLLYQEEGLTRWAFYYYKMPSGEYRLTNLDATQSTTHFRLY